MNCQCFRVLSESLTVTGLTQSMLLASFRRVCFLKTLSSEIYKRVVCFRICIKQCHFRFDLFLVSVLVLVLRLF